MAYASAAVYDAVVAIEGGFEPYGPAITAPAGASIDAAVIEAAYAPPGVYIGLPGGSGRYSSKLAGGTACGLKCRHSSTEVSHSGSLTELMIELLPGCDSDDGENESDQCDYDEHAHPH
jgi:hypothetical protein